MQNEPSAPQLDDKPWWKYGHVWLLIAGPAAVVVAGFITLYLAISRPDPVTDQDYYRKGIEMNKARENAENVQGMMPALTARNHSATGVPVKPEEAKPAKTP